MNEMMNIASNFEKLDLRSDFLILNIEREFLKILNIKNNVDDFLKAKFVQQILNSNFFSNELKESIILNWISDAG